MKGKYPIQNLPAEVVAFIFAFLHGDFLLINVALVCKSFHQMLHIEKWEEVDVYEPPLNSKEMFLLHHQQQQAQLLPYEEEEQQKSQSRMLPSQAKYANITFSKPSLKVANRSKRETNARKAETSLGGLSTLSGVKLWVFLCEQQFKSGMKWRRKYPSLMRPLIFYVYHLREEFYSKEIYEYETLLRNLEQKVEEYSKQKKYGRFIQDSCAFCPELLRLYFRRYKIYKDFDKTEILESEFSLMGVSSLRNNPAITSAAFDEELSEEAIDEDEKPRLTLLLKINKQSLQDTAMQMILQETGKESLPSPQQLQQLQNKLVEKFISHVMKKWTQYVEDEYMGNSNRYVSLIKKYNTRKCKVFFLDSGFSYQNNMRAADQTLRRTLIYLQYAQDRL